MIFNAPTAGLITRRISPHAAGDMCQGSGGPQKGVGMNETNFPPAAGMNRSRNGSQSSTVREMPGGIP